MLKKTIKRASGILLMIIVLLLFVNVMEEYVTKRDDLEALQLKGYYLEDKHSLDVVIMGASEVVQGYAAPEIYKKYGFTSFPYCFTINPVPLWKYELRDIERDQNPKVLMVEINGAVYKEAKYIHSKPCLHRLAENMPFSTNKIRMIMEMSDNKVESFFPIVKYHDRWTKFPMEDVADIRDMKKRGHMILRGSQSYLYRTQFSKNMEYPSPDETMDLIPDAEEALRDFLAECQKSSIENIVFVSYPHFFQDEDNVNRQKRVNRAGQIIKEAGFEFIDLGYRMDEIGLVEVPDFYDAHHMNAPGQKKTSDYLGKLIKEKYNIEPTALSDRQKAEWDESVDYIERFYRYFDEYTKDHASDPYKKPDLKLRDRVKPIKVLTEMGPVTD